MHDLILVIAHVLSMLVRLTGTGGVRSVIAESALLKHQLLIVNRPRHRAPNLRVTDRFIVAVCSLFIRPARLLRSMPAGRVRAAVNKDLAELVVELEKKEDVSLDSRQRS